MDAEQKLMALKKAYADIILNISKEAAARVMSSEKKAARCQHELKMAKEESLRMLVRLKQMMDSKINEAETSSLHQQKKIEELEAQLQEAEDIVKDLREELREGQAELERVKSDNFQPANEPGIFYTRDQPVADSIYSYQPSALLAPKSQDEFSVASEEPMPYLSLKNECHKCYNNGVCMCGLYIRDRDLPSIILRGKEPGLYRNGCRQRIRACERNLSDKELCVSANIDRVGDKKDVIELGEGKDTRRTPDAGTKSLSRPDKNIATGIKTSGFKSIIQKKKRTFRRRKVTALLTRKQPLRFLESLQSPELSTRTCPISVKDNSPFCEDLFTIAPRFSTCKGEPQIQPECAESCEKETSFVEVCGVKNVWAHEETIENMIPRTEETGYTESLLSPECKVLGENINIPSSKLEKDSSDTTQGLSNQSIRERVIKYTFQRKRKRQDLSNSDVIASPETEKKMRDEPNGDQEMEQSVSSLLTESSRESRRLAQVARQLISLSEKKWWQ